MGKGMGNYTQGLLHIFVIVWLQLYFGNTGSPGLLNSLYMNYPSLTVTLPFTT